MFMRPLADCSFAAHSLRTVSDHFDYDYAVSVTQDMFRCTKYVPPYFAVSIVDAVKLGVDSTSPRALHELDTLVDSALFARIPDAMAHDFGVMLALLGPQFALPKQAAPGLTAVARRQLNDIRRDSDSTALSIGFALRGNTDGHNPEHVIFVASSHEVLVTNALHEICAQSRVSEADGLFLSFLAPDLQS